MERSWWVSWRLRRHNRNSQPAGRLLFINPKVRFQGKDFGYSAKPIFTAVKWSLAQCIKLVSNSRHHSAERRDVHFIYCAWDSGRGALCVSMTRGWTGDCPLSKRCWHDVYSLTLVSKRYRTDIDLTIHLSQSDAQCTLSHVYSFFGISHVYCSGIRCYRRLTTSCDNV